MAILISFNATMQHIVTEIETLNEIEQLSVLAFIKAKKIQIQQLKPIAGYKGNLKAPNMEEIDAIKHKVRNQHANK